MIYSYKIKTRNRCMYVMCLIVITLGFQPDSSQRCCCYGLNCGYRRRHSSSTKTSSKNQAPEKSLYSQSLSPKLRLDDRLQFYAKDSRSISKTTPFASSVNEQKLVQGSKPTKCLQRFEKKRAPTNLFATFQSCGEKSTQIRSSSNGDSFSKKKPLKTPAHPASISLCHTSQLNRAGFDEGAFYGITSLVIATYLIVLFLYPPTESSLPNIFSSQEWSWAATNAYIVALISHYLRRQERLRIHSKHHTLSKKLTTSPVTATRMNDSDAVCNKALTTSGDNCTYTTKRSNLVPLKKTSRQKISSIQIDENFLLLDLLESFRFKPIIKRSAVVQNNKSSVSQTNKGTVTSPSK